MSLRAGNLITNNDGQCAGLLTNLLANNADQGPFSFYSGGEAESLIQETGKFFTQDAFVSEATPISLVFRHSIRKIEFNLGGEVTIIEMDEGVYINDVLPNPDNALEVYLLTTDGFFKLNAKTGQVSRRFEQSNSSVAQKRNDFRTLAISPKDSSLAVINYHGEIFLLDRNNYNIIGQAEVGVPRDVNFSADGKKLYVIDRSSQAFQFTVGSSVERGLNLIQRKTITDIGSQGPEFLKKKIAWPKSDVALVPYKTGVIAVDFGEQEILIIKSKITTAYQRAPFFSRISVDPRFGAAGHISSGRGFVLEVYQAGNAKHHDYELPFFIKYTGLTSAIDLEKQVAFIGLNVNEVAAPFEMETDSMIKNIIRERGYQIVNGTRIEEADYAGRDYRGSVMVLDLQTGKVIAALRLPDHNENAVLNLSWSYASQRLAVVASSGQVFTSFIDVDRLKKTYYQKYLDNPTPLQISY